MHIVVQGACRINSSGHGRAHHPSFTTCCASEPSHVAFISIAGRSTSCGYTARSTREGGHARESSFPVLRISDRLRHHPPEYRFFARISGNVGTTKGLHARRLAAMRRANPRCGQDRGLPTAKYSATQRSVPRGFRTRRCAFTGRGSRLRTKALWSRWAAALRSRIWAKALRQGLQSKALLWP